MTSALLSTREYFEAWKNQATSIRDDSSLCSVLHRSFSILDSLCTESLDSQKLAFQLEAMTFEQNLARKYDTASPSSHRPFLLALGEGIQRAVQSMMERGKNGKNQEPNDEQKIREEDDKIKNEERMRREEEKRKEEERRINEKRSADQLRKENERIRREEEDQRRMGEMRKEEAQVMGTCIKEEPMAEPYTAMLPDPVPQFAHSSQAPAWPHPSIASSSSSSYPPLMALSPPGSSYSQLQMGPTMASISGFTPNTTALEYYSSMHTASTGSGRRRCGELDRTLVCPLCMKSGLGVVTFTRHLAIEHHTTPNRCQIVFKCECGLEATNSTRASQHKSECARFLLRAVCRDPNYTLKEQYYTARAMNK